MEALMTPTQPKGTQFSFSDIVRRQPPPDTTLPLFGWAAEQLRLPECELVEAHKYIAPRRRRCVFLNWCKAVLSNKLAPADARGLPGFFVYIVTAPYTIDYPMGRSTVKYIGFTTNAHRRFNNHKKVRPGDRVQLLALSHHLYRIEQRDRSEWNSRTNRQRDTFAKQAEAALLMTFKMLLGQLPRDNHKREHLNLDGHLLTGIFAHP